VIAHPDQDEVAAAPAAAGEQRGAPRRPRQRAALRVPRRRRPERLGAQQGLPPLPPCGSHHPPRRAALRLGNLDPLEGVAAPPAAGAHLAARGAAQARQQRRQPARGVLAVELGQGRGGRGGRPAAGLQAEVGTADQACRLEGRG